jgi:TonB family protein
LGIAGTFSACNASQQPSTPISEQEITTETVNADTISADTILAIPPLYTSPDIPDLLLGKIAVVGDIDINAAFTTEGEILPVVEQNPEYPGGDEARLNFFRENMVYPTEAKEKGIQGRVYVSFVVDKDGSITDVTVLRGIGGGCDEEAVRVVKMMPKWKPGEQRGERIRVSYSLPIKFSLDSN